MQNTCHPIMGLKFISLNVKGLRDNFKREMIFQWIRQESTDICFLQETHCYSENDVKEWSNQWAGKAYWSPGTNNSKGVGILFKEKLDIDVSNIKCDKDGRYLSVFITIDDAKLNLVNIYAPNDAAARANFFVQLQQKVASLKTEKTGEVIIGGDFNCALDSKLDRRQIKNTIRHDRSSVDLKNMILALNLEDVWRRRNPSLRRFTFFKPNSKTASRIDFWLTEKTLDPLIVKSQICQAIRTDHASIQCVIKTSMQERGPGYWKMNKNILDSDDFHNSFMAFWEGWKKKINTYKSKRKWWEITKYKIKTLFQTISKKTSLEDHIKQSKLSKRLEMLNNDINANQKDIKTCENLLEELYKKQTEGAKVRAKTE